MFLKTAFRQRLRDWPATLTFALTVGSALAVCAAWYAIAGPLLLQQLPFPNANRVAAIESVSWADADDLKAALPAIEKIAVYTDRTWGVQTRKDGHVEVLLSAMVTPDFFQVLGIPATVDDRQLWLSAQAATNLFGDPATAQNRTLWVNDVQYRVAGITPHEATFPLSGKQADMVLPLDRKDYCCTRGGSGTRALALLKPGTRNLEAALQTASAQLAAQFPDTNRNRIFHAKNLRGTLLGPTAQLLQWLLMGALCLLGVALANGSGVWMARWVRDQRHTAIQLALGATHARILSSHALQGAAAGAVAGLTGIAGAWLILKAIAQTDYLRSQSIQLGQQPSINTETVALALLAGIATGALSAVIPHLARTGRSIRTRLILTTAQLTLTATLGWLGVGIVQNVQTLLTAGRGFATEQLLVTPIGIPEARYSTDEKMIRFHQQVIEKLHQTSGVESAAGGASMPVSNMRTRFLRDGETTPRAQQPTAQIGVASPELIKLLGIQLKQGRGLEATDRWTTPTVALVNEAFLKAHPVSLHDGLRLSFYNGFARKPYERYEVVGIIADTRNDGLQPNPQPQVIISSNQMAMEGFYYFVKTTRTSSDMAAPIRQAIWSIDPALQKVTPRPLLQHVEASLASRRALASAAALFLGLSLVIVAIGLFSSLSATLSESTRELAIRAALGATPARVAYQSIQWAVTALGVSTVLAAPIIYYANTQIAFLEPSLKTLATTAAILALTAIAASLIPAWRASALSPAAVLKAE